MNASKILNIFLFALLFSIIFQYFFAPKKEMPTESLGVILSVNKESFTIPNIPVISIQNTSTGTLRFFPCKDFHLTIDSLPVVGFSGFAPAFCHPIKVESQSGGTLAMKELYPIFAKKSGKYVATLSTAFGERTVYFTVDQPGMIRTLLSTLIYQPIYNLFVAFLLFLPGHSLGWAIICLTIIIRLILLVPQQQMLEGQKKLQKIQPKIQALQKEHKNDQAVLGMKMLELYKAEKVNPMASILPLFIQMPILICLYWVISEIGDPSNFYHMYSLFRDMFHPAEISTSFYGLSLDQTGGIIGGIFALCLALLQFLQAKLSVNSAPKKTPLPIKKEGDDTSPEMVLDPAIMQNMMLYFFPIMIGVTAYFFPLGVGLYWFIGTIFVIAQQYYVNRKK